MVVNTFSDSKLLFEIIKGIKTVRGIELLVILAVRALYLTVVPGCANTNEFVTNAELTERLFKKCFSVGAAGILAVGEFKTVVRLYALNGIRETLYAVLDELCGRVSAVLLKCL